MVPIRVMWYILFVFLVSQQCQSRSVPEEASVVSVYTTQATTVGGNLDVYHQIANNIAERITSPIYRFLGYGKNKTETTMKSFAQIELIDDSEISKPEVKPVDNDISRKDVEEISADATKKSDKKPEKITLYSNYLPVNSNIELNDTVNEVDDTFGFDDDDDEDVDKAKARPVGESIAVFFFEFFASLIQLIYGGFMSLFYTPSNGSNSSS